MDVTGFCGPRNDPRGDEMLDRCKEKKHSSFNCHERTFLMPWTLSNDACNGKMELNEMPDGDH